MSIQKWLRECTTMHHFFDTRHISEGHTFTGLGSKLNSLAKKFGCQKLNKWIRSLINQLYWSIVTTSPDLNERLAKWESCYNHIRIVHRWDKIVLIFIVPWRLVELVLHEASLFRNWTMVKTWNCTRFTGSEVNAYVLPTKPWVGMFQNMRTWGETIKTHPDDAVTEQEWIEQGNIRKQHHIIYIRHEWMNLHVKFVTGQVVRLYRQHTGCYHPTYLIK